MYNGQPIPSAPDPSGHYTAMVWQNTREIGCGFAGTASIDILVCRYNPAGNIIGQMPYGNANQAVTDNETTLGPDQGALGAEDSGTDSAGTSSIDSRGDSGNEDTGDSRENAEAGNGN